MPPVVDQATGILYAGTGNPSPDFAGGQRPGADPDTDGVLALRASTGAVAWFTSLAGHDVSTLDETRLAQVRNAEIGFVFQQFHLLPTLPAWRNVELPLVYAGMARPQRKRLAMQALERVGLGHRVEHRPNELSGGQQQRVAVARALVTNPAMILADEPTGNLDSASTEDVLGLFSELHAAGSTIVLITHEHEVASRASRRVKLADGLVVSDESDDLTDTTISTLLGLPAQRGSRP